MDEEIEDEGSRFAALEAATLGVESALAAHEQEAGVMPTALVIEDNQDLCWHIGEVLGEIVSCEFAHDGETGLRIT